ncbi:MAG: ABC transporter permease [Anaerolineae bacterium]|nr:ABC transporter permease [Anaerolineae bacterium]
MRRMWTIMRKEFIHIWRDPRTLIIILIMPVTLLLLLGYAIAVDIKDIPTVVYDQSLSAASRRFLDRFWQTGDFKFVGHVNNPDEMLQWIDRGDARVGIIIPPDFGTRLAGNRSAAVQVFIDGSDPTVAQTALLVAQSIGQAASVEIISQQLGALGMTGGLALPIDLRARLLYNPDMKRINFMVPGLLAAILQMQTLFLTAFAIVREREQGTMEQLIVTPIKAWELMLGKILPFLILAILNVGITLVVASFWFRVEVKGSAVLLFVLALIFLLGSLGLGILISTVSRTQMQAMQLAAFVILPMLILSGFLVPRENMPWLANYTGYLFPITYFLVIIRTIIVKGVGIVALWNQAIPLAVFSLTVFVVSALAFRKWLG